MAAKLGWFLALMLALVAVAWMFQPLASSDPFAYDESDYMYAGAQGFGANYWDRNSMPLWDLVSKGLELRRDPQRRGDMSQYVRASGDLSFYRHYHGPVYAYWIGWMKAIGVSSENGYRASGLILHAAGAIAIFWLFLSCFPALPPAGALAAALAFVMSRTALLTAVTITQHIAFEIICILTLFAAAKFLATANRSWWYATAALAGLAFATVEIAAVLIAAIVLSVAVAQWSLGWKHLLRLILSGLGWFFAAVALVWPQGVIELNAAKGYLYLAYMALGRRTFSPVSPLEMWGNNLVNYPLEFVPPLLAVGAMIVYYRRARAGGGIKPALLPFLVYAVLFAAVTMVVTLPYAHYHGSMLASAAVVLGAVVGELWTRLRQPVAWVVLGALAVSLTFVDRALMADLRALPPSQTPDVLRYVRKSGMDQKFIPYFFVPPLHYYHPELQTTGYDTDWTAERLAQAALAFNQAEIICTPALCDQIAAVWPPASVAGREVVSRLPAAGQPLDAIRLAVRQ